MNRRNLTLIMENKPGALARVVGLFHQRGYNIESLHVDSIEDISKYHFIEEELDIKSTLDRKGLFGLRVNGDSMIDANIADGDLVLMEPVESKYSLRNGDIVSAYVSGLGTTLKYFQKSNTKIILEPANSAYEPLVLNFEDVSIQGRLDAVWRNA